MRALTLILAASFAAFAIEPTALAQETTEQAADETNEQVGEAVDKAQEAVEEEAEETAEEATEAAGEAASEAKEMVEEAAQEMVEETPELRPSSSGVETQNLSSLSGTSDAIGELQPSQIDIISVEPVVSDAQRAAFEATSAELQRSIEIATLATDNAKTRVKTHTQEVKVAKAEVSAAKLKLKAAKSELKVKKLQDDEGAERVASEGVDLAKVELTNAKDTLKVKNFQLAFAKEKLNHAKSVKDLEEAKLAEAQGRAANPPIEQGDLLKLEKTRLKNEGGEAKARTKVAKAELKLEKARK